jgi:hypothetical protein
MKDILEKIDDRIAMSGTGKRLSEELMMAQDEIRRLRALEQRIIAIEAWIQEWEGAAEEYGEAILEGLEVTLVPDQELLDAIERDKSKDN